MENLMKNSLQRNAAEHANSRVKHAFLLEHYIFFHHYIYLVDLITCTHITSLHKYKEVFFVTNNLYTILNVLTPVFTNANFS